VGNQRISPVKEISETNCARGGRTAPVGRARAMVKARSALKRLKETRIAPGRGPVASSNANSGASVILFGFIPLASAHLLDCALQVVVESATRPSIVAQAFEFDSDALRFSNGNIGIVAQNGVRCGRRHTGR